MKLQTWSILEASLLGCSVPLDGSVDRGTGLCAIDKEVPSKSFLSTNHCLSFFLSWLLCKMCEAYFIALAGYVCSLNSPSSHTPPSSVADSPLRLTTLVTALTALGDSNEALRSLLTRQYTFSLSSTLISTTLVSAEIKTAFVLAEQVQCTQQHMMATLWLITQLTMQL